MRVSCSHAESIQRRAADISAPTIVDIENLDTLSPTKIKLAYPVTCALPLVGEQGIPHDGRPDLKLITRTLIACD